MLSFRFYLCCKTTLLNEIKLMTLHTTQEILLYSLKFKHYNIIVTIRLYATPNRDLSPQ